MLSMMSLMGRGTSSLGCALMRRKMAGPSAKQALRMTMSGVLMISRFRMGVERRNLPRAAADGNGRSGQAGAERVGAGQGAGRAGDVVLGLEAADAEFAELQTKARVLESLARGPRS